VTETPFLARVDAHTAPEIPLPITATFIATATLLICFLIAGEIVVAAIGLHSDYKQNYVSFTIFAIQLRPVSKFKNDTSLEKSPFWAFALCSLHLNAFSGSTSCGSEAGFVASPVETKRIQQFL
jgi:hypothetical protein